MSTPLEFPGNISEKGPDQTGKKAAMLAGLVARLHRTPKPGRPTIPQRAAALTQNTAESMAILACIDILSLIQAHIKAIAKRHETFEVINKQIAAEKVFDKIKALNPTNFIKTILDDIVSKDNSDDTITDIVRRHFTILFGDFEDDWLPLIEIQAEINHFISCVTIIAIKKHQSTRRVTKMPVPPVTRDAIAEVIVDTGDREETDRSGPIDLELENLPDDDADALIALATDLESQQSVDKPAKNTQSQSAALEQPSEAPHQALPFDLDEPTPPPEASPPQVVATQHFVADPQPTISLKPPRTSNRSIYFAFALLSSTAGIGGALWSNRVTLIETTDANTTTTTAIPQPLVPTVTNVTLPAPSPVPEIPPSPQQRNTTVSVSSSFYLGTHSSLKLGVRNALLSNTAALAHCITRPNTDPRHLAYGLAGPITSFIRTRGWNVGTPAHPRGVTITWTDNGQCNDFTVMGWENATAETRTIVHPQTPVPITTPIATIVTNRALYHRLPPGGQ